jgi:hypothetical protein
MLVIAREKLIIAGNYVYIVIFYFIVYTKAIKEDRPHAQIMAYQWVQARIRDMVIENEDKDTKIWI